MMISRGDWRRNVVLAGLACAIGVVAAGCNEPLANSGVLAPNKSSPESKPGTNPSLAADNSTVVAPKSNDNQSSVANSGDATGDAPASVAASGEVDPAQPPRTFAVEGPDGALRINFGDLDLQKLLNMNTIGPDCVEKMPPWLKGLVGKRVRIRGFMKPGNLTEGIPQFVFVRSTDLCCFEPKGRVDHLVATTLKPGVTTDYIAFKPFDVVGTFRIDLIQLDDGLIILLYHIDDAVIIRN